MKVAMVGAGYVGLVSGACFADFGHEVHCIDTDGRKIDALREGRIPIFEPGLSDLVATNVAAGRLRFDPGHGDAFAGADVVFIAVGTPSRRGDGHADLSFVYAAARDIARSVSGFKVVVTKSTVPVGTGDEIERIARSINPGADIAVVSNPEFLREGAAIADFRRPDRIVIGTDDPRAEAVMRDLYRPVGPDAPILVTGRRTAELTKYAANAFLATKIAFINEMADLAEAVGADVLDVARGMGLDARIGAQFLRPGPGFGGSCFPKDTTALVRTADEAGAPLAIVEAVVGSNEARKLAMADKVVAACGGSVAGRRIAVLGLAFKPDTDDVRDAPALAIIPRLQAAGATVTAYDPEAMEAARRVLPDVDYAADIDTCLLDADAAVIVTEWDAFRRLDLARTRAAMARPVLVDLRNVLSPEAARRHGFNYAGIGRGGGSTSGASPRSRAAHLAESL